MQNSASYVEIRHLSILFFTAVVQPPVAPAVSQMRHTLGVKTTNCLSSLLLTCGISMVIIQIIFTAVMEYGMDYSRSAGIWCGIFIVISGIIGYFAAAKKTNELVSKMEGTRS